MMIEMMIDTTMMLVVPVVGTSSTVARDSLGEYLTKTIDSWPMLVFAPKAGQTKVPLAQ